ncbi:MAG TPA: hypothetical protein VI756_25735 [Blastocatellia bacterium]
MFKIHLIVDDDQGSELMHTQFEADNKADVIPDGYATPDSVSVAKLILRTLGYRGTLRFTADGSVLELGEE